MEETRCEPKYKKFIIKWVDGSFGLGYVEEKFIVSSNEVMFEREIDGVIVPEELIEESDNIIKWTLNIFDIEFEDKFTDLCDCFIRTMDEGIRIDGCDIDIFTIEVVLRNGTKIERNYKGTLIDNELFELTKKIKAFIPSVAPKPYFLEPESDEYEDDNEGITYEDDLPFFKVDKETKFFIGVDRENTIVRKRKNIFELEVISKERPYWRKTEKNSYYEREYYFGQGNTCLFDIKLDKVLQKFREWDIPLKLIDEE